MRRFYKTVSVVPTSTGFAIALDGKTVKTPGKLALVLASESLAEAIAGEWMAQESEVVPATMPLMKLAATALDRVAAARAAVVEGAARYAASDLLCYRADRPASLIARQAESWQPLLDWAADRFIAPLRVTSGVVAVDQPLASLEALFSVVAGLDLFSLTAVADLTGLMGSLVLALAIWDGRLTAEAAARLALLDEEFQAEHWGIDDEAAARLANIRAEITAGALFISLHRRGIS